MANNHAMDMTRRNQERRTQEPETAKAPDAPSKEERRAIAEAANKARTERIAKKNEYERENGHYRYGPKGNGFLSRMSQKRKLN